MKAETGPPPNGLGIPSHKPFLFRGLMESFIAKNDRSSSLPKANSRELLAVLGLAILGCVLRIVLIPFGDFITSDGVYYATLAQSLLAGDLDRGLSTYWSPFYPLLISLFAGIFRRDPVQTGRIISALAGGMTVVPAYFITRRFSGRRVIALVAALFVIFDPLLIHYSLRVLTESVYTLLLTSGILIGWVAIERSTGRYFLLTGLVFGLAYLTRPEALGYVFLLCLIISVVGFARKAGGRWLLSRCALVVLGALLAAAPYVYYLRQETGRWTITEKFATNLPSNNVDIRKLLPDGQLTRADVAWAGTRPELPGAPASAPPTSEQQAPGAPTPTFLDRVGRFAKHTLKGLYHEYFIISELLPPLFLILSGVGLFAVARNASQIRLEIYIGSFIFATFLGYAATYHNERYLVPLLPLALGWAATGAVAVASWFYKTFGSRARGVLRISPSQTLAVVTLIVVASQLVNLLVRIRKDPGRERLAAEWIRSQGLKSPLIMATGPWPAFYTAGRHLYIPNEDLTVVLAYAKRKNVDFMVLEERWLDSTPCLAPLLAEKIPQELTLVYEHVGDPKQLGLRIFRLGHEGDRNVLDAPAAQEIDPCRTHRVMRAARTVEPETSNDLK
ncbi:MAG: glycosyltransferase family 39 protein [Pyrinomonadaceae bacterium]|nr:glycosyltransferase family 39 protein [Pyrinomonadaceae bacterium]